MEPAVAGGPAFHRPDRVRIAPGLFFSSLFSAPFATAPSELESLEAGCFTHTQEHTILSARSRYRHDDPLVRRGW